MLVELRGVVVGGRRVGVEAALLTVALLTVLVLAQQFGRLTNNSVFTYHKVG